MKILIINNGSKYIYNLRKIFSKERIRIVDVKEFDKSYHKLFDAFILSGSSKYSVVGNLNIYSPQISLIKNTNKPVLGICLGFELISYAFNEKLIYGKNKIKGIFNVNATSKDPILEAIKRPLKVFKSHKWKVNKTKSLKTLAVSETGVEIAKHPEKIIYGMQFHPELEIDNENKKLIDNFIRIAKGVE